MESARQEGGSYDRLPEAIADEVAFQMRRNLREVLGEGALPEVAQASGVPVEVLERALRRPGTLNLADIALLEAGLGVRLWPIRFNEGG